MKKGRVSNLVQWKWSWQETEVTIATRETSAANERLEKSGVEGGAGREYGP